jgi:predicted CXXCH cytochrome family protein
MSAAATRRLLAGLVGVALAASAGLAAADKNWKQNGNSKATTLEQCVRPTAEIRRHHMDLLKHQRDITVHLGVRKTTDALAGCIDCHANKDAQGKPVAVNAEGQFCQGCHAFTAVHLDCFQCHSTVPESK